MSIERFLSAQDGRHPTHQHDTYVEAIAELQAGRKRTHWMWYVFPQVSGLGRSDTAREFGIASMTEVVEYLSHPTLSDRYLDCSRHLLAHVSKSDPVYDGLKSVLGGTDAAKFRSSITLFGEAARICGSLQRTDLADIWAGFKVLGLRACPETLDFVVASPPWCP
jgi:uncharacterized protein (DUF1810 family)